MVKKNGDSYLVKVQTRVSATNYSSEALSLPKRFLKKIVERHGEEPVMFKVTMDEKGRIVYEPKFLK